MKSFKYKNANDQIINPYHITKRYSTIDLKISSEKINSREKEKEKEKEKE